MGRKRGSPFKQLADNAAILGVGLPHYVLHKSASDAIRPKAAFEKGWNKNPKTPEEAEAHVAAGELAGVIPGSIGLVVVDVDHGEQAAVDAVIHLLGAPLVVIPSGRRGRFHLYYRRPDRGKKITHYEWEIANVGSGEVLADTRSAILYGPDTLVAAMSRYPEALPVDLGPLPKKPKGQGEGGADGRNNRLNRRAFLAARRNDSEGVAAAAAAAAAEGLPMDEVERTTASAVVAAETHGDDLGADTTGPWARTACADAIRFLRHKTEDLLCVRSQDGNYTVLVDNGHGVWQPGVAQVDTWILEAARAWGAQALSEQVDDSTAKAVVKHARTLAKPAGTRDARASVGQAIGMLREDLPPGLTLCAYEELDRDLTCLGAPNGVIDLNTGQLLGRADSRARLVSRRVPDEFIPTARHEAIDLLLNHLTKDERRYILDALGYALRGQAGRLYALTGRTQSGKSSLLVAVQACLGDVKALGYHTALADAALLQDRHTSKNAHTSHSVDLPDARIASRSELPKAGKIDVGWVKNALGGENEATREVGEKKKPARPFIATFFLALNPPDVARLDLRDEAFADRVRILRYPALPNKKGTEYRNLLRTDKERRQAMLALLVAAARENPVVPADIPSVRAAVDERRAESLGELGQWLTDTLVITGDAGDRLPVDALWAAALTEFDRPEDADRVVGRTRRELVALAHELTNGLLPTARMGKFDGRKCRYWSGVALVKVDGCAECGGPKTGEEWGPGHLCGNCLIPSSSFLLSTDPLFTLQDVLTATPTPALEVFVGTGMAILERRRIDPEGRHDRLDQTEFPFQGLNYLAKKARKLPSHEERMAALDALLQMIQMDDKRTEREGGGIEWRK